MSAKKTNNSDYQSLASTAKKSGVKIHDQDSLKPPGKLQDSSRSHLQNLKNLQKKTQKEENPLESIPKEYEKLETDDSALKSNFANLYEKDSEASEIETSYSEQQKIKKKEKKSLKDRELLSGDRWLVRNGHVLTFFGLYLFSVMVLFRPYELIPQLGFLSATAFYLAAATLAIYLPTQFMTEGNFTILSTEIKAVLALVLIAVATMPIAKSPAMAWENFNDTFIKSVLVFVVMVNVIRTRKRLIAMMWLSISIGGVLSYIALGMYMRGEMNVEGYRVGGGIRGMFENPNEMSVHLIMMMPLVVTLALASKSSVWRIVYLAIAILMLSANLITFSRGGFLGLLAASAVLAWKLGRKNRFGVMLVSSFAGVLLMLLAPGGFGLRVLSIFIPGLDPVGSSDQRRELLERSIVVSIRNPWGIGIGNFPIVGVRNLVSHNAYTQVSAELGVLGLIAYLIFILSPFRKLGAIERTLYDNNEFNWFYYLSIGLQASIVAYLVSSFFASIAFNWFIYYLIAYAVAFRRVYQLEKGLSEEVKVEPFAYNLWRTKAA
jgi:O-antigen ligase